MLNPADATFAERLAESLPKGTLAAAPAQYLEEPRGRRGTPKALLARPRSTEEVARIVAACNAGRVGIVPWGGGSGLVLGQVMPEGPTPLILSLERMSAVRGLWPDENVVVVEAGMILADLHANVEKAGRLFPLKLASQGSARIGGNLATNAGGTAVLRYGNMRDLCLGVEAVLPDGSVYHGLSRLRKDNTGYDLRHLMIGSEGTLGVITAASLRLFPIAPRTGTAFLSVAGPAAALQLLGRAQSLTGGNVTTFELVSGQGLRFLAATMPELRQPLASTPDWSVLVELSLTGDSDPEAVMTRLFEEAVEVGLSDDGVIAASGAQRDALWQLREALPEGNRRIGAIVSHDISLPLSEIAPFLPRATEAVKGFGPLRINCFGHLGDGNLHFNIFPPEGEKAGDYSHLASDLQKAVHDVVYDHGGSISAEHGIGRAKVDDLARYGDPTKLMAMRAIKAALDPCGIMNPGAVLPAA